MRIDHQPLALKKLNNLLYYTDIYNSSDPFDVCEDILNGGEIDGVFAQTTTKQSPTAPPPQSKDQSPWVSFFGKRVPISGGDHGEFGRTWIFDFYLWALSSTGIVSFTNTSEVNHSEPRSLYVLKTKQCSYIYKLRKEDYFKL